ncbi:MAG: hypothetical protein R3B39_01345 [Candidatus Paceibacterota bacterium]
MENNPELKFNAKRELTEKEEAVMRFFEETEIEKLSFDTEEEAKDRVDMINAKYGNIAFVAEDRGKFSVKFNVSHLGEGFKKYDSENREDGLEEAA